ncbi:hypothetical protein B0H13DRAFT_1851715 [Mycena leptocephala]|nr:hypothetical protein B0H13DRAFT_1851715 [Mycena leptocephala]
MSTSRKNRAQTQRPQPAVSTAQALRPISDREATPAVVPRGGRGKKIQGERRARLQKIRERGDESSSEEVDELAEQTPRRSKSATGLTSRRPRNTEELTSRHPPRSEVLTPRLPPPDTGTSFKIRLPGSTSSRKPVAGPSRPASGVARPPSPMAEDAPVPSSSVLPPSSSPPPPPSLREQLLRRRMVFQGEAPAPMEHSVDGLEKQLRNVEGKLAYVVPRLEEISDPSWRPIPVFVRPPFEWPPSGMPPPDFSELATLPPIVDPAPYPPYKAPEGATPFLLDQAFHEWKEGYTAHVGLVAANQFEAARRANREVSIARRQKDEWLAAKAAERDTHNRIREAELQTEAANLNERNVLEDRHDELCRERDDLEAELTLAQDSFSRAIAARSHLLGLADEMYHVDRQRRAMGDHESLGIDIDLILEILHARNPPDGHVEHSPLPSSPSIGSSTPVPAAPAVPASPAPAPISPARSPTKRKRSASREKSKKRRRTSSPPDFSAEEYEAAFDGQVKETLDKISEEELEVGPGCEFCFESNVPCVNRVKRSSRQTACFYCAIRRHGCHTTEGAKYHPSTAGFVARHNFAAGGSSTPLFLPSDSSSEDELQGYSDVEDEREGTPSNRGPDWKGKGKARDMSGAQVDTPPIATLHENRMESASPPPSSRLAAPLRVCSASSRNSAPSPHLDLPEFGYSVPEFTPAPRFNWRDAQVREGRVLVPPQSILRAFKPTARDREDYPAEEALDRLYSRLFFIQYEACKKQEAAVELAGPEAVTALLAATSGNVVPSPVFPFLNPRLPLESYWNQNANATNRELIGMLPWLQKAMDGAEEHFLKPDESIPDNWDPFKLFAWWGGRLPDTVGLRAPYISSQKSHIMWQYPDFKGEPSNTEVTPYDHTVVVSTFGHGAPRPTFQVKNPSARPPLALDTPSVAPPFFPRRLVHRRQQLRRSAYSEGQVSLALSRLDVAKVLEPPDFAGRYRRGRRTRALCYAATCGTGCRGHRSEWCGSRAPGYAARWRTGSGGRHPKWRGDGRGFHYAACWGTESGGCRLWRAETDVQMTDA